MDFTGHSNPMAIGLSEGLVIINLQKADFTSPPAEGQRQFQIKTFCKGWVLSGSNWNTVFIKIISSPGKTGMFLGYH